MVLSLRFLDAMRIIRFDKCKATLFTEAPLKRMSDMARRDSGMKRKSRTSKAKAAKEKPQQTIYAVLWWHFQKPYVAVVPTYDEAKWIADTRNGVIIEIIGKGISVKSVVDFYRRDEAGNPMPAEMRPCESPYPNALVRAQ